jgi:protein-disulfide isomerase
MVPTMMSQPTTQDHFLGDLAGPVMLIQYGDYQCPRSAAAQPVVAAILLQYPAGLRYSFRHFPMARVHPMATLAAETAEYAAMQGRFWPMHWALLANAHCISLAVLLALGRQFGLPADRLRDALALGLCAGRVQRDVARAILDEVYDTPTFFINGRLVGAPGDGAALAAAVDAAMTAASRPVLHLRVKNERRARP